MPQTKSKAKAFADVMVDMDVTVYNAMHSIASDYHYADVKTKQRREEYRKRFRKVASIGTPSARNTRFYSIEDVLESVGLSGRNAEEGKSARAHQVLVGKRIAAARRKKGMTQKQLADKSGIQQSHISRIENGIHCATYKTIAMIAMCLGRRISELDQSFDNIGERVFAIRKERKMSLVELSRKSGIAIEFLEDIESEEMYVDLITVRKIAAALDVRNEDVDPAFNIRE
ncbi:MAG: helix-turn-helix transcriptional regulator [Planctomycetota bacterium]